MASKRVKRAFPIKLWESDLMHNFNPKEKLFLLWIYTNPHTTQLGIYHVNPDYIALETKLSIDEINNFIKEFENLNIIIFSKETNEIAIPNYLLDCIVQGGKGTEDLILKEIKEVENKSLIDNVFQYLLEHDVSNKTILKVINEYFEPNNEKKNEKKNEKENENENEKSYHHSYHDSYSDSYSDSLEDNSELIKNIVYSYQNSSNINANIELSEERKTLINKAITSVRNELSNTGKSCDNLKITDYFIDAFKQIQESAYLKEKIEENNNNAFQFMMENIIKVYNQQYIDY